METKITYAVSGTARGYATNLRADVVHGTLRWDSTPEQDALIVQTPFQEEASDQLMVEVCASLSSLPDNRFVQSSRRNDVFVRFVSCLEKQRNNGCSMNGTGCTYTVFPCTMKGKECVVYAPVGNDIVSPRCDVMTEIRIETAQAVQSGFLGTRVVPGYYEIRFPEPCPTGYHDGDACYQIGKWRIPITERMFREGQFYVRSNEMPQIISRNPGLRLKESLQSGFSAPRGKGYRK